MGFLLKEEIAPARLQQALEDLRPRFPSFFVSVRKGFFRYYLVPTDHSGHVRRDKARPCQPMHLFSETEPLLRVLYDRRRLSVELSHLLADGGGALVFVQALLARYLELGGVDVSGSGLPKLHEQPQPGELADSYRQFSTNCREKPRADRFAWQYRAERRPDYLKVVQGQIPLEDILPRVKERGLTVTGYLMCAYLYAFYTADPRARRSRKPIQLTIPVSLRKYYPSESLRNFTLYANLGFSPYRARDELSRCGAELECFEVILQVMHGQLAAACTKEEMHKLLCQSVRLADNALLWACPNFLKRHFMRIGYRIVGEEKSTSALSNLGQVQMPPCLEAHVDAVEIMLGSTKLKRLACVVFSFKGALQVFFSGDSPNTQVQREFFRLLASEGMRVQVGSNM